MDDRKWRKTYQTNIIVFGANYFTNEAIEVKFVTGREVGWHVIRLSSIISLSVTVLDQNEGMYPFVINYLSKHICMQAQPHISESESLPFSHDVSTCEYNAQSNACGDNSLNT